eukprot:TRINITY_DN20532_c0_g1_i1.p1 TRINITY_DN20532_c0_g1~~TRINITY_DN20532_c0_g1_i1.p1  ORF type:complete len:272 (+),score=49.65 TRINITY_DN20532_c0_g1_i1:169-984(+)
MEIIKISLLLVWSVSVVADSSCPKGCTCTRNNECKVFVECRRVKSFPKTYPDGTDCLFINSAALRKATEEEKQSGFAALPVTLKRLDLSESRLGTLFSDCFHHLSELRVLNLEFNNLRTIPAQAFSGLSKLKVLWLTGNHYNPDEPEFEKMQKAGNDIVSIDKTAFNDLLNLQVLLMHHNQIAVLDEQVFQNLSKLKVLKLLDNPVAKKLKKSSKLFDPIRKHCYQLDIKRDSGDDLEDYWEETGTYLGDDWFEGPPGKKRAPRSASSSEL